VSLEVAPADLQTPRAIEPFEPLAEGGRRWVTLKSERVILAEDLAGMQMQISLEPGAFVGVLLRIADLDDKGFLYEIMLMHRAQVLSVLLETHRTDAAAISAWREWTHRLKLPGLVEHEEGVYDRYGLGKMQRSSLPPGRRMGNPLRRRRPRFLTRRHVGQSGLAKPVAPAREISDPWRPGR
jgi:hypothetical protein